MYKNRIIARLEKEMKQVKYAVVAYDGKALETLGVFGDPLVADEVARIHGGNVEVVNV